MLGESRLEVNGPAAQGDKGALQRREGTTKIAVVDAETDQGRRGYQPTARRGFSQTPSR